MHVGQRLVRGLSFEITQLTGFEQGFLPSAPNFPLLSSSFIKLAPSPCHLSLLAHPRLRLPRLPRLLNMMATISNPPLS